MPRLLAILLVGATLSARAALPGPGESRDGEWIAAARRVDPTTLDRIRGGFSSGGLVLSIGIERTVRVDGTLVTRNVVGAEVGSAGGLPGSPTGPMPSRPEGVGAVTIPSLPFGTALQNAADGRTLESRTVIDAAVNSLGLLRQSNWQSSMRHAVIDSLRR